MTIFKKTMSYAAVAIFASGIAFTTANASQTEETVTSVGTTSVGTFISVERHLETRGFEDVAGERNEFQAKKDASGADTDRWYFSRVTMGAFEVSKFSFSAETMKTVGVFYNTNLPEYAALNEWRDRDISGGTYAISAKTKQAGSSSVPALTAQQPFLS